jgi:hypothetical protein
MNIDKDKCKYCYSDFEGYYRALDRNGHITIFDKPAKLHINFYGNVMGISIKYCPMCRKEIK